MSCFLQETVDDALRFVGHRKYTVVGICFQRNTSRFEPVDGILCVKRFKGFSEEFLAARVVLGKQSVVEGRIGHVASTPSGNFCLSQEFARLFQDTNMGIWEVRFSRKGGKEACCSSDDGDFQAYDVRDCTIRCID